MKNIIGYVISGNQGPSFQGHVATSKGANFLPGPPSSMGAPHAGVPPLSTFPLPTSSVPSGMPPHYNQPAMAPPGGMPPPPGVQQGMPPQPVMPPPVSGVSGVPQPSPAGAPQVPGPPTSMGTGITGRRQYPHMVNIFVSMLSVNGYGMEFSKIKVSNLRKGHPACTQFPSGGV